MVLVHFFNETLGVALQPEFQSLDFIFIARFLFLEFLDSPRFAIQLLRFQLIFECSNPQGEFLFHFIVLLVPAFSVVIVFLVQCYLERSESLFFRALEICDQI